MTTYYSIPQVYEEFIKYINENTYVQSWKDYVKNKSIPLDSTFLAGVQWTFAEGYQACNEYFKNNVNEIFANSNIKFNSSKYPTEDQLDQLLIAFVKLILNARQEAENNWEKYAKKLKLNDQIIGIYYLWIKLLYLNAATICISNFENKVYFLIDKIQFITHENNTL